MSLQFYLGASGSGKSYQLHKDINQWAKEDMNKNFFYIVPDQFTMQTQMDMVESSSNKGIMNIDVLSFNRLAHRIFEETGVLEKKVLDDTGKSLIIRKIAADLKDELKVIGPNINKLGYIHEIKSVISEFKQYDVTEDKLNTIIDKTKAKGLLNAKIKDIGILYSEFNNYIRDKYIASEEILSLLIEAIKSSEIIKNSVVVFDGFTGFTPVQYRFIQCLLGLTDRVIVSITIDIDSNPYKIESEQELFYLSKKTIFDLQRIAEEKNIIQLDDVLFKSNLRSANSESLSHLERNLFRYPVKVFNVQQDAVTVKAADSVEDEINNICIRIKNLVLDQDYRYSDISVVCGDMSSYSEGFKQASLKYDIPVFIDQNSKLILNPFVEYLRSALIIIRDDFSYNSIMHFLRSGLTEFADNEIDIFDNYLLSAGIRGKKKYCEVFTKKVNQDLKELTEDEIDKLNRINEIRSRIVDMLMPLMKSKESASFYAKELINFASKNAIEEKLKEYEEMFIESMDINRASEYRQIYRLVIELLEEISNLLADEVITIDEFIKTFEAGINEIDVGKIPEGIDRVLIGDIERTRVPKVKILFLAGVNEGNVPKANLKGGIISDYDREFLKDNDFELSPTPREQIYTQRLYLYMNMTKPSERLIISYAKTDNSGKALKASYLIGLLEQMFPALNEGEATEKSGFNQIVGSKDALTLFASGMSEYADSIKTNLSYKQLLALYKYFNEDSEYEKISGNIVDKAFFEYKAAPITKELTKLLYGEVLRSSISRLESFAKCEYAHFLKYGLKLKERDGFEFEKRDLGTVYHGVLENFTKEIGQKGYTLSDFPEDEGILTLKDIVTRVTANYGTGVLYSTYKNEYVVSKINDIMARTILTLKAQIQQSNFVTEGVEVPFEYMIDIDNASKMRLTGVIDRIDVLEKDNDLFVKIIDYKSGKKDIKLGEILHGIKLQQPVYMIEAINALSEKYPEKTAKMAAMLYYNIDDPNVEISEKDTEEAIELKKLDALRPTGKIILNSEIATDIDTSLKDGGLKADSHIAPISIKDGAMADSSSTISETDYETLSTYTQEKIKDFALKIAAGEIDMNPYNTGKDVSCTYCEYKAVCGFDERQRGYKYRKLQVPDDEKAIERMKECL